MPTAIVPHSKAKGIDFCGTEDYYYIVRSDVGVYMKSSNFNEGSDIEIFDLHLSCRNGENYLASEEGYFYIIKGDSYRKVSNMNTDGDAQVFALHPNCRGGDSYYSINDYFYIVFLDKGVYRKTSNMNEDSDAQEFSIHDNCKNGLYYWGTDKYVYFVESGFEWGVEYHKTSNMNEDSDGQTFSMHKSVVNFLPGGVAIAEGTTFGKWELAKSFVNSSDSTVHWVKEVTHQQGVKKSALSSIEHNWSIKTTASFSTGNLSGAFAQKQFSLEVQYGGKKVDTTSQSWNDVKTVKETIDVTLEPHQQVWIWFYVLGLGTVDILFCRDMQSTNTSEPPTNDPLPPAK